MPQKQRKYVVLRWKQAFSLGLAAFSSNFLGQTSVFLLPARENTVFYERLGRSAGVGVFTECKHSVVAEGLKHDDKVGGFLSEITIPVICD